MIEYDIPQLKQEPAMLASPSFLLAALTAIHLRTGTR
jgi:hypothetical protein